jgi:hypothetical protein
MAIAVKKICTALQIKKPSGTPHHSLSFAAVKKVFKKS